MITLKRTEESLPTEIHESIFMKFSNEIYRDSDNPLAIKKIGFNWLSDRIVSEDSYFKPNYFYELHKKVTNLTSLLWTHGHIGSLELIDT